MSATNDSNTRPGLLMVSTRPGVCFGRPGPFLSGAAAHPGPPTEEAKERWRQRYRVAVRRLQQAGIPTVEDEEAGARYYVALRTEWDGVVGQLASALAYTREEIDPAGTHPERMVRAPPPMTELAREPFPEGPLHHS
jgi:hypothetical protein